VGTGTGGATATAGTAGVGGAGAAVGTAACTADDTGTDWGVYAGDGATADGIGAAHC
jgi:hypothetical protein